MVVLDHMNFCTWIAALQWQRIRHRNRPSVLRWLYSTGLHRKDKGWERCDAIVTTLQLGQSMFCTNPSFVPFAQRNPYFVHNIYIKLHVLKEIKLWKLSFVLDLFYAHLLYFSCLCVNVRFGVCVFVFYMYLNGYLLYLPVAKYFWSLCSYMYFFYRLL